MNDDFLLLVVSGIIIVVGILVVFLIYTMLKEKEKNNESSPKSKVDDEVEANKAKKSIFKFMEFDSIEDNMIVQDGGKRYLMVVECKGVNYDLLSSVEKSAVEQGFIGFLNALKFEIQLYVQTRKVNLVQSTLKYRERLKNIEMDMIEEEQKYQNLLRNPEATKDEIVKGLKEVTKKKNLYTYASDIIENTEQMSRDSDLTTKQYYIVVPYYTDEITTGREYNKREIGSLAFSELYTRSQALAGALSECDVRGRILNSKELIELLFISYNREQHDTYDFEEYINASGYDSFYSVSPDVLQKRIKALDEEIEKKGREKALDAYKRAYRKKERALKEIQDREDRMSEYINEVAKVTLDAQSNVSDKDTLMEAKKELYVMDEEKRKRFEKNKDEVVNSKSNEKSREERKAELAKKLKEMTPEERARHIKKMKMKKMLKEQEAKKNA